VWLRADCDAASDGNGKLDPRDLAGLALDRGE
jgi:hypothetical protein